MSGLFGRDAQTQAEIDALPDEARTLYTILEHDGAGWRREAERDIAQVNERLQATMRQLASGIAPVDAAPVAVAEELRSPHTGVGLLAALPPHTRRARRTQAKGPGARLRALAPAFVAVAVVAAFAVVFATGAARRGAITTTGANSGATSVAGTSWVNLTALDSNAVFSANDLPAIAPSDPRVVYQTFAQGLQQGQPATLRRTDDGGARWQTLASPVAANHIGSAGIGVSPLDPHVAFLSIFDTAASDCPANRAQTSSEGLTGAYCRLEFTTTDGGAHWSPTQLPLANDSTPGLVMASNTFGMVGRQLSGSLSAQGTRLFGGYTCAIDSIKCTRLVTSDDGGRSWRFADLPLLAGGAASVRDYVASPTGGLVYAVTSPKPVLFTSQDSLTLWRSDDGAKTWSKVGALATPNERGLAVAQNATTGASELYMALSRTTKVLSDKMGNPWPLFSSDPQDVKVSVDGGKTWTSAPGAGIPVNHTLFLQEGFLGTLSDGSVVVDVIPVTRSTATVPDNFSGSGLYAWKLGDSAWRPIGDVPREVDALLVTTSGASDTLYATLTTRSSSTRSAPASVFEIWRETLTVDK